MLTKFNKIFFLSIACSLWTLIVNAQTEYIVTVTPNNNAAVTKIDSIHLVRYIQTLATYNQSTKEYTFIGTWQPGQSPSYLYTLDAVSGNVISNPLVPEYYKYIRLQYSRTTGKLYGIISENNIAYLASIDKTTGVFTLMHDLPGINSINTITIDEDNQYLYFDAGGGQLFTIDLASGIILSHITGLSIFGMQYDNVTHKIYGITAMAGGIFGICSYDPSTGILTNIAGLPSVTGLHSGAYETINENDHRYFFGGSDQNQANLLYSVDFTTGVITSRAPVPTSFVPEFNNLILFHYDNLSSKLYAMLWEAHTDIVVPLTLNKFDAIQQGRSVDCKWQTLQEANTNHFEIERSEDAVNFTSIGKLKAKGNSIIKTDYDFLDHDPFSSGKTYLYYRLKMVDNDAHFNYSNTVKVKLDYASSLNIFPNPVSGHLSVDLFAPANDKATILITDHVGRKVYTQNVTVKKGSNRFQINTSLLAAGAYNLSVIGSNNYFSFSSFVK